MAILTKMLSFFCNFLKKNNSLRKFYFEFLNIKLKNELQFKIKLTIIN